MEIGISEMEIGISEMKISIVAVFSLQSTTLRLFFLHALTLLCPRTNFYS